MSLILGTSRSRGRPAARSSAGITEKINAALLASAQIVEHSISDIRIAGYSTHELTGNIAAHDTSDA